MPIIRDGKLQGLIEAIGVAACNRNRPDLQSARFSAHIMCLYPTPPAHISCL